MTTQLLNGALECGLRTLALLAELHPRPVDLGELVMLDYLLVHSSDVLDGPPSLHPPSPLRSGEVAVRRQVIADGLTLLLSRRLVTRVLTNEGFQYIADDSAPSFLGMLNSYYATAVRSRAQWVARLVAEMSGDELTRIFDRSLLRWRAEFAVLGNDDSMALEA